MAQTQQEQQQFRCTGDCLNCIPVQRQYCAAQNAYNNMRALERIEQHITTIEQHFANISQKMQQSEETQVFNPNEIAQEWEGAEE